MKSVSLIFFTLAIVFIVVGYMELKIREKQNQKSLNIGLYQEVLLKIK